MEKSKKTVKHVIIFILCEAIVLATYFCAGKWIEQRNYVLSIKNKKIVTDYKVLTNIDDVNVKNEEVSISGWVFRTDSRNKEIYICLHALDYSENLVSLTETVVKKEVADYYELDAENGNYGFCAKISEKELQKDVCYEVLIYVSYEEIRSDGSLHEEDCKISTNQFLYNGELYQYNPTEFLLPEITDQEMVRVMEEGYLRAYDMEEQVWIYQYENRLYYIVNEEVYTINESDIGIPVMPRTTCVELLPEHRKKEGFDHLGTFFADERYRRNGVLPYQVAVVDIDTKYPISYVSTGLYDIKDSKWKKHFTITVVH